MIECSLQYADREIYANSQHHLQAAADGLALLRDRAWKDQPTGWWRYPNLHGETVLKNLQDLQQQIPCYYDAVVCVGIGGSYLGAKAIYRTLRGEYADLTAIGDMARNPRQLPLLFAGHNLSQSTQVDLEQTLDAFQPLIVVVSKSGETLEPGLAFRFLRQYLGKRYSQREVAERIICVTDPQSGTLRKMAVEHQWRTLAIPNDIGGRFSVFTNAGVAPLALAGYEMDALFAGGESAFSSLQQADSENCKTLCQYASYRRAAYLAGKRVEVLASFEAKVDQFLAWYQQLYGESLGKEQQGLCPLPLRYSDDLHSMGQYLQDGQRNLTQTLFQWQSHESPDSLLVPEELKESGDGLGYLVKREYRHLTRDVTQATLMAHSQGGVGSLIITQPQLGLQELGQLFAFFQSACAVEGAMADLNPFNQPGVEDYKKNMFALFGRPGYEELGRKLRSRLI
jgi:glucose-6-phosphate isomerase